MERNKIIELTKDFKLCYPCEWFLGLEKDGKLVFAECCENRDCTKCEICRSVAKILIEDC